MKKIFTLLFTTALLSSALNAKKLKMYACGITRVSFVKELNRAFGKKFNVKTSINKKGGVSFVLKGLSQKKIMVGAGCRETFKTKNEKNLWSTQVAWGALGFIVNPKNKINNLSTSDIKKILTGEITNWKEVGGKNKPINLILRAGKGSGVGSTARKILFNNLTQTFSKKAKRVKSSGPIRKAVAKDIYAFAIDDVTSSRRIKNVKLLNVDGVKPTKENILSNNYKVRRAFFLYLGQKPTKLAKKYIDFALSEEGQKVISKTGTANLEEATGKDDEENLIFQNLQFDVKTK